MNIVGVTGDTHFGHANIILYTNRPFVNKDEDLDEEGRWIYREAAARRAAEMDNALIAGWNSVAKTDQDIIVHLGDFSFGQVENYLDRLNGKIWFVTGNHDKQMRDYLRNNPRQTKVKSLGSLSEVDLDSFSDGRQVVRKAVVCHFAMRVWNKSHYGNWHLYGHSHASLDEPETMLSTDVGVDAAYKRFGEFRPFRIPELEDIMSHRKFKPVDHHEGN